MTDRASPPLDEQTPGRFDWLDTVIDGRSVRFWIAVALAITAVVLGIGAFDTYGLDRDTAGMTASRQDIGGQATGGMGAAADAPRFPPVTGLYEGEQVLFVHTEASDPKVADLLTGMMGSPVITVPELARVPVSALGDVYVFTNGVKPQDARGPMGFQADVFDSAPGDDGYTPLRTIKLVKWNAGVEAELLTSEAEVEDALARGAITVGEPGVVVNMPFVTWPRGQR